MAEMKTSPKGLAHFPHLNTPDTRFDVDGVYQVRLRMDSDDPEVAEYIEWIDEQHEESKVKFLAELQEPKGSKKGLTLTAAKKKLKDGDKPYQYVEDEDGEPTNEVLVNYKMRAHVKSKKTGKSFDLVPKYFDAKGAIIKGKAIPLIYGGSLLKVGYTPIHWGTLKLGASVSLRMEAVQIINLITGGGSERAEDYGFGAEDGGYEAPDASTFSDESETSEPGGEADDDGTGDF